MVLKLILRYESEKEPFSRLFQIASVEYKVDIKVLQQTVLNRIGASLKKNLDGGNFQVYLDEERSFCLS
jgi:hypothetical protein